MDPFFPLEATAKGLSAAQIGVVSAIVDVPYCLASLCVGPLLPRIGLRNCLSVACLALAAGAAAFAAVILVPSGLAFFVVCLILRSFAGAAGAIADAASCTFVMDRMTEDLALMLVS